MYLEIRNMINKASQSNHYVPNKVLQRKCVCAQQKPDDECLNCSNSLNPNNNEKNNINLTNKVIKQNFDFPAAKVRAPDYFDSRENNNGEFVQPYTGPLPYRQATELADCIRIMGQENTAHCRSVVLGEESVPLGSTNSSSNTQTSTPASNCDPTAMTRTQYLAEPGTSQNDFGLTTLRGSVTIPTVHTSSTRRGRVVSPTSAALPPLTSVFTGAGRFVEGQAIFAGGGDGGCRSGRYPLRWTITPSGAQKIKESEQEHCDDFNHAFNISLNRFAAAVNTVAQSGRTFRSQRHAERHIERIVEKPVTDWSNVFQCLARKTLLRDGQRGLRGSHTPHAASHPPTLRRNCQFAEAVITGRSLRQVGQRSSSQLITGC